MNKNNLKKKKILILDLKEMLSRLQVIPSKFAWSKIMEDRAN